MIADKKVHFARNLLAHVPKTHTDMVAAVFRTIFVQPDPATVAASWDEVRGQLAGRFPKIGTLMDNARPRCSRSPRSPVRTGPKSGAPTRWSELTRRSSAEPAWWGYFPTN